MKKTLLSMAAIALSAAVAQASVVTFTLHVDTDGSGVAGTVPGAFYIDATVSTGDNAGLSSFFVGLNPAAVNLGPGSPSDSFIQNDVKKGTTAASKKTVGFSIQANTASSISAAQNPAAGANLALYGIGQGPVTWPAANTAGGGTGYTYVGFGAGLPDPVPAPAPIGTGFYTGTLSSAASLIVGSSASVWTTVGGTTSDASPTIVWQFDAPASGATNEFVLGTGANGESATTTINMTQAPNHINPNYTPEITPVDSGKGLIAINGLDPASTLNEMLVWSSLSLAELQAINPAFAAVEPRWSLYGATAELGLPTGASSYTVAYDLTNGQTTGTLTGVAIVPEPASLGLLALGALGLLGKRRSK